MDIDLGPIAVPVADVGRARDSHVRAGFVADHDHRVSDAIGTGIVDSAPGSSRGLQELPCGQFRPFSDPDGNGWAVGEAARRR